MRPTFLLLLYLMPFLSQGQSFITRDFINGRLGFSLRQQPVDSLAFHIPGTVALSSDKQMTTERAVRIAIQRAVPVAGAGISFTGAGTSASPYTITNTGLLTTTTFSGSVNGTYNNLLLGAGSVGSNELSSFSVTGVKINQMGAATGQVLKWNGSVWGPDVAFNGTISGSGPGVGSTSAFKMFNTTVGAAATMTHWNDGTIAWYHETSANSLTLKNGVVKVSNGSTEKRLTSYSTPTVSALSPAGTGATVTITGDDISGRIELVTGSTGTGSGEILQVTFAVAYTGTQPIQITNAGANGSDVRPLLNNGTVFRLYSPTTLTTSTTYTFYYKIN